MQDNLEQVISWLEAGEAADYQAGVLLLQVSTRNRALVAHLLRKESPANREKLTYELVKLGCEHRLEDVNEVINHFAWEAVQGAVPAAPPVVTVPGLPAEPAPDQVPEAVRGQVDDLTQLMARVHTQRCQLSNQLADIDPAEGPQKVAEILGLQAQYNALAQKRRNLVEGTPAPEAEAEPAADAAPAGENTSVVDRAELVQRRLTLRSNISKGKGKLAAAQTEAKRSEHQEKVAKWEVELQTVEMQLAQPQA